MRRSTLATLILLTASRAAAAEDFDALIQKAGEARRQGDAETTLSLLEQAYEIRPLPELLNNIGRTLEDMGRYREAANAYRRVIEDPAAKPQLVALDRERLAALEPKLDRAWVLVEADPVGVRARVDGGPVSLGEEHEIPIGPHLLQLTGADGRMILLTFFKAIPSRRVTIRRDLEGTLPETATLDVEGTISAIERLYVEDHPVHADWRKGRLEIRLPPGTYRVRAELEGREPETKKIRVEAGSTAVLASVLDRPRPVDAPPPSVDPAAHVQPASSGPGPWPLVVGVTGAVAAGLGTFLIISAEMDRDRVRDAERNEEDVVVGITMIEAVRLEDRADDKATAALVAGAGGGAMLLGALLWWLLDDGEAAREVVILPGPGRFSVRF